MKFSTLPRRILNRLQPITSRHSDSLPISDLFPWRVSREFDTCFQAHDIRSLFYPSSKNTASTSLFVAFNPMGIEILRKYINVQSLIKTPLSLSSLFRSSSFEYGTFSIFHDSNPQVFDGHSLVLSERGYLYFTGRESTFSHYVHGNFDAITLSSAGIPTPLGGLSFLPRFYNFQYIFDPAFVYDLFFVNPTSSDQSIKIYESSAESTLNTRLLATLSIPSRGSFIYEYHSFEKFTSLSFRSKIVLARPICFKRAGLVFDVFHA